MGVTNAQEATASVVRTELALESSVLRSEINTIRMEMSKLAPALSEQPSKVLLSRRIDEESLVTKKVLLSPPLAADSPSSSPQTGSPVWGGGRNVRVGSLWFVG